MSKQGNSHLSANRQVDRIQWVLVLAYFKSNLDNNQPNIYLIQSSIDPTGTGICGFVCGSSMRKRSAKNAKICIDIIASLKYTLN